MSYCRFSDNSDVYMYPHIDGVGVVCCACSLSGDWYETRLSTVGEALKHLQEHIANGDKVPAYAMERLQQEITI